jgi:hypothetical protein
MSDYACSKGCFICNGTEAGNHNGSCCASTRCNSRGWDRQISAWLKAEQKYKKTVESMTTRWLIAEQLYLVQVEEWLVAEQQWVAESSAREAAAQVRRGQELRAQKKVNRVNVPARGKTPTTSASQRVAAMTGVAHG